MHGLSMTKCESEQSCFFTVYQYLSLKVACPFLRRLKPLHLLCLFRLNGTRSWLFLNRCIFRLLHDYLTGRCSSHFHTICLGHQSLRTRHPLLATASRRQRRRRDVPTSLWIARQQEWQEWQQECISYHFDTFSYSMSFCFLCGGM